jgi:hypothetical protein
LDYFGRPAYLAQSPQLVSCAAPKWEVRSQRTAANPSFLFIQQAKQQAIIADMGRVYEIGSICELSKKRFECSSCI